MRHVLMLVVSVVTLSLSAVARGGVPAGSDVIPPIAPVDLGTLGGSHSHATAINERGQVVGVSTLPGDTEWHPFSWTKVGGMVDIGQPCEPVAVDFFGRVALNCAGRVSLWSKASGMVDLGTLGGDWARATAMNSVGQVIGESTLPGETTSHGFSWTQAGGMVDLGECIPRAVNVLGVVVGECAGRLFLWTRSKGMVDAGLQVELYGEGRVRAVSTSGQVVGSFSRFASRFELHAFSWTKARGMVDLGALSQPLFSDYLGTVKSEALAVNDLGEVAGANYLLWRSPYGNGARALVWTRARGMIDISAPDVDSMPLGVSAFGQVVCNSHPFASYPHRSYVWTQEDGIVDLGGLGGAFTRATAMNSVGQVAGGSTLPGDTAEHAVMWTLPAPW